MGLKPPRWTVEEKRRNVHQLRLTETLKSGTEAWLLWMADEHWDNPACNLELLKQHHDEAIERRALIVKVGDTFCAMQGKGDPRGDKGSVRAEHWGGNYLDLLVNTAAEWYAPWKKHIAVVGLGNHETSVYKHHETCLIERLCQSLRDKGGIARKGGYSGWIKLKLSRNETFRTSYTAFYHHGYGGGGPVTKGVIDYNRIGQYIWADAVIMGHVHEKNVVSQRRMSLNDAATIVADECQYVRCGTYKDEYEDGFAGFHVEKGRGPRPMGGWWQRISVKSHKIIVEWMPAQP